MLTRPSSTRARSRVPRLAALPLLLLGAPAACSAGNGGAPPEFAATTIQLPGPPNAPALAAPKTPPEELPGVDTGELSDREEGVWWSLVSQLYAPCTDQAVSVQQCVKESRPCAACAPAAQLIAKKVRDGMAPADVQAAYAVRFGPNLVPADPKDSPSRGPATAPVTIVVWSDFQCPACRFAMPVLDALLEKHEGKVRLVHKFYPLKSHNFAEGAARAAVAAKNQGKYWEMERVIFDHQSALAESDLEGYARELGLDMNRYQADLKAPATTALIERDKADADTAGLNSTPHIVINGRHFDGSFFRVDKDLDDWIALEVRLTTGKR